MLRCLVRNSRNAAARRPGPARRVPPVAPLARRRPEELPARPADINPSGPLGTARRTLLTAQPRDRFETPPVRVTGRRWRTVRAVPSQARQA